MSNITPYNYDRTYIKNIKKKVIQTEFKEELQFLVFTSLILHYFYLVKHKLVPATDVYTNFMNLIRFANRLPPRRYNRIFRNFSNF
jgi:hypothetical protein